MKINIPNIQPFPNPEIKEGDQFNFYGKKLIARKSCPKNKIFIIDDCKFKTINK